MIDVDADADFVVFNVKYSKSILTVRLPSSDTLADLKGILYSLSDVPAERQKLIGLSRAKLPPDSTEIQALTPFPPASVRAGKTDNGETQVTFMLVGTPEADTFKDPTGKQKNGDVAIEQVDVDYAEAPATHKAKAPPPAEDPVNLAKLEKTIARFSDFSMIHEPRPGKGLLVLDLDYTLADTKRLLDPTSMASEAARPGLHTFLKAVYPFYDICVWSQTSWRWLETKLIELNMLSSPDVNNISFVLDRTPMFSIQTPTRKHEVKPLELIWRRFPQWNKTNTVHIDDLSRNFAMNAVSDTIVMEQRTSPATLTYINSLQGNGVKIKAYKHSPNFDTELAAATKYCLQMALVPDVSQLSHKYWKNFIGPEATVASAPPSASLPAPEGSSGEAAASPSQPVFTDSAPSAPSANEGNTQAKESSGGAALPQSEDHDGSGPGR